MNRPDPAVDLIGFLRVMGEQIDSLLEREAERRVTAAEAARTLGYGPRHFDGKPWRIPGFGAFGTMHALSAWKDWLARPETERRAEWDAMPATQRRKVRGAA